MMLVMMVTMTHPQTRRLRHPRLTKYNSHRPPLLILIFLLPLDLDLVLFLFHYLLILLFDSIQYVRYDSANAPRIIVLRFRFPSPSPSHSLLAFTISSAFTSCSARTSSSMRTFSK